MIGENNMDEQNKPSFEINPFPVSKDTGDALAKPIAASLGEAGKTILDGIFHFTLDPIRKFNIQRSYALEQFEIEVKESVSKIPDEFLDDSMTGVVLKTIEDSRYQLNHEDIRKMFSNLISATLDSRENSRVSPKYSSIISDMSPREAILLQKIYNNKVQTVPLVNLKVRNRENYSERTIYLNHLLLDSGPDNSFALELSLLESANLITLAKDFRLTSPNFAEKITDFEKSFGDVNNTFRGLLKNENEYVEFFHSTYFLTELGSSFCNIVFENNRDL
ncbi:DUF4393 domain-containing protein [Streptococcus parasuis]|uniref:DUF4393 domain-containing protein n=1 Tax=Streptococcus parasuis TaxID=1501662 RepID=UPI0025A56594|nr:DUF4393 domain-containing protein [Streptococcus parasuis]WJQ85369.1 DUF4393 domain-containing protein [Streptococcus parasuis]